MLLLELLPSKILDEPSGSVVYMKPLDSDPDFWDAKAGQFGLPLCLLGWQEDTPSETVVYMKPLDLDLHSWDAKADRLSLPVCLWGWQDDKPREKEMYLKRLHPSFSGG